MRGKLNANFSKTKRKAVKNIEENLQAKFCVVKSVSKKTLKMSSELFNLEPESISQLLGCKTIKFCVMKWDSKKKTA